MRNHPAGGDWGAGGGAECQDEDEATVTPTTVIASAAAAFGQGMAIANIRQLPPFPEGIALWETLPCPIL